jgi:hypothetical protein
MFSEQRMGDVYVRFALQSLRCVTSGVEHEPLCTTTQESNAAAVADAHKNVHIQGESFGLGEKPAATPVLIAQFDLVRSATDDLAQFFTLKKHIAWTLLWSLLSR